MVEMNFKKRGKRGMGRKAQLAVFVIIAIVIVAGIAIFFAVRGNLFGTAIPAEFQPVFSYYEECIKYETKAAIDIAETQGGFVDAGEYIPGSEYAPFSSHFNFLGFPVPYWYYVSGNGIIKENAPTKNDIENGIEKYIEAQLQDCNFEAFYQQGLYISVEQPSARVRIEDTKVRVDISSELTVENEENSASKSDYAVEVDSKIGKFYNLARKIYEKEKDSEFLENYSVDVLRLYAPVDGVEVSCSPKIWKTREVVDELKQGLEANIGAIKFKGNYYTQNNETDKYFVVDLGTDESVNIMYSKNWPAKVEIVGEGVDDDLMIAQPIGNQQGLGVLGFCYVPYHFVYDVSFPVLIQIYDGIEIFQFPVAVIIDNNVPRRAIFSEITEEEAINVCAFNTQDITVNVFDINLNNVDANISFECFDSKCLLGETKEGVLNGKAPACVNGFLVARTDNYAEKKQLFSSNEESIADIILDREYEVEVEVKIDGKPIEGLAVVNFNGDKTASVALPDSNKIKLHEGLYNISVYAYSDSEIKIPASKKTECINAPRGGIFGLFGATREECIDIAIPETKIEYALIGGGRTETYILESELQKGKIVIDADSLPKPNSLEELQYNFEAFESLGVGVSFIAKEN